MREAGEAGLKHVLIVKLRDEHLKAVAAEQKAIVEGQALEQGLRQLEAKARQAKGVDAKKTAVWNKAKKVEGRAESKVTVANRVVSRARTSAERSEVKRDVAKAKLDGLNQAKVPKEPIAQLVDTQKYPTVAKHDQWGEAKCSAWIKSNPNRCKAANYQFNCAKTCSMVREGQSKIPATRENVEQKYSAAKAASKTVHDRAAGVLANMGKLKKSESAAKAARKASQEQKVLSAVNEKKSKAAVQEQLTKLKLHRVKVVNATTVQTRIASMCHLLQEAMMSMSGAIINRVDTMVKMDHNAEISSVEEKADNVGLIIPANSRNATLNASTMLKPWNASDVQLQKEGLFLQDDWGAKRCTAWVKQDPQRCKAPNYKLKCAKSCTELLRSTLANQKKRNQRSINAFNTLRAVQLEYKNGVQYRDILDPILTRADQIFGEASKSITELLAAAPASLEDNVQQNASNIERKREEAKAAALKSAVNAQTQQNAALVAAQEAKEAEKHFQMMRKADVEVRQEQQITHDSKPAHGGPEKPTKAMYEYHHTRKDIAKILNLP